MFWRWDDIKNTFWDLATFKHILGRWYSDIKKEENYCLQKRQFPCIEIYSYLQIGAYSKIHVFMGFECIKTHVVITLLSYYIHAIFFSQKSLLPRIFVSSSKQVVMFMLFKLDLKCIALHSKIYLQFIHYVRMYLAGIIFGEKF